jgi:uncharacterized protein
LDLGAFRRQMKVGFYACDRCRCHKLRSAYRMKRSRDRSKKDALYQKFINALTSEAKLTSARRVVQAHWDRPELSTGRGRILEEVQRAARPAILVAHSLGVLATVPAVAPPSSAGLSRLDELDPAFVTLPGEPLSFPTVLVASRDDKYRPLPTARHWRRCLAQNLSTLDFRVTSTSGHGPWPEGLMSFDGFLKML